MDYIETYNECQDLLTQFEASNRAEVDGFLQLLEEFTGRYKYLKEKLPYHINVIDELHVNENANSRILASLLQYNENGEYTLLKSFVRNRLRDWNIEVSEPQITSEDWRIDLLVREKGKYAIIFENKIYDAVLQKNQLARYIIKMRNENFDPEQIYVVFLPPQKYDPTDCSWKVPIVECEICCDAAKCPNKNSLKAEFEDRFKTITFREDIIAWLEEDVVPNCRQKELYLYTAAMQYLDYLKGYFDLRTINKNMNMELQDYLINKLGLENKTDEQQLEILDRKTDEIQRLLNQMNDIKAMVGRRIVDARIAVANKQKWESLLPTLNEVASAVSITFNLQKKIDFVFPENDEDSRLFISFFEPDWNLSIIFEKYHDQSFFTYIGIPGEEIVDQKYLIGKYVFSQHDDKNHHPYGWEYIETYHLKPAALLRDIENGSFERYLENKVRDILQKIKDNQLPMK